MADYVRNFLMFILCVIFLIFGMLLYSRIAVLEDKIDAANEMLVQLRTNGIIGERVR